MSEEGGSSALQLRGGSWRSTPLLACLIVFGFVVPMFPEGPGVRAVRELVLSGVLIAGVVAVSQRRVWIYVGVCLLIPTLLLAWLGRVLEFPTALTFAGGLAQLAFVAYTGGCVLWLVLSTERVTADTLAGAVAVYLLIGVGWGMAYQLVILLNPEAIQGAGDLDARALFYYSFVTLTTLGFGDMTPVSPAARSLTTLEAVTGQVYLAILVARMVGLHLAGTRRTEGEPPGL